MSDNLNKHESPVRKNDSKRKTLQSALIFPLIVSGYSSYSAEVEDEDEYDYEKHNN